MVGMADERYPADQTGDEPGDATRPLPESRNPDETAPMAPPDGTRQFPKVGETAPLPAVEDEPAGAPTWSARASVRPAGGPEAQEWQEPPAEDPYGGRSWFTPILIGGLVLILLAVLGTGVWLIYRATRSNSGPTPVATASASASPSRSPTTARTSATRSPSAAPTTSSVPAGVPVPNVVGSNVATATATLTGAGFKVTVVRKPDDSVAPGTVLSTDPPPDLVVPPGTQVTLVVASAPPPPTTAPAPSTSTSRHG
jgi:hypothetical protein